MTARVTVKPGRERSIRNRHPWLFSGAILRTEGEPSPGDPVDVCDEGGRILGWGFYNPLSDIRVRLAGFSHATPGEGKSFLTSRIRTALHLRREQQRADTDAMRLVNAEGDGLSGLIVDSYAGHLVVEPLARWVADRLEAILDILTEELRPWQPVQSIRLRIEEDAAHREGFALKDGPFPENATAPERVRVRVFGLPLWVDLLKGQKTGLFLDQLANHALAARYAAGRHVLNLFSYTGGFTLQASPVAASLTSVDSSGPACELLRQNAALSAREAGEIICGDVRRELPKLEESGRRFGLVIVDPPPFARRKEHVTKASRAYQDINRRSMGLIEDGYLMTFSCSPFMDATLFRQVVFSAAAEARRNVQVLQILGPGPDHPVSIYHPEGNYLTGLLLRVTDPERDLERPALSP